jgi:hypothetical protein
MHNVMLIGGAASAQKSSHVMKDESRANYATMRAFWRLSGLAPFGTANHDGREMRVSHG